MKSIQEVIQGNPTLQKIYQLTFLESDGNPKRCEQCKKPMFKREGTGEAYCYNCEIILPEDKKIAEEAEAAFQSMQFHKQLDVFQKYSLINAKLEKACFDNYQPLNPQQIQVKKNCEGYVRKFRLDKPASLVLFGPYGTGKSHLAKSMLDEIMKKDVSCLFISMPKLYTRFSSTFDRKKDSLTEFDIMEIIAKVQLLVLDDIGAEKTNDHNDEFSWSKRKFFEIVDSRAGKHNIFTMNHTPERFFELYGERDASRALEDAYEFEVPGKNYRMRNKEWYESP